MTTTVRDKPATRFDEIEEPPAPKLPATRVQAHDPAGQMQDLPSVMPAMAPVVFPQTGIASIAKAISEVIKAIEPVAKRGWNDFHKFKYARIEDVMMELSHKIAEQGLMIVQTEVGRAMFDNDKAVSVQYQFTIAHISGEVWPERPIQTGLARCRDSKGGFDDKALNKCHTAARKYFLVALFMVPTEDVDDADRRRADSEDAPPPATAKPHKLPTNNSTFGKWKAEFIRFIERAHSEDEVVQWERANDEALNKINEGNPALYTEIEQAIRRKLGSFDHGPSETEQVTWGDGEPEPNAEPPPPAPVERLLAHAAKPSEGGKSSLTTALITEIGKLTKMADCIEWTQRSEPRLKLLSERDRNIVDAAFQAKQDDIKDVMAEAAKARRGGR